MALELRTRKHNFRPT